MPPLQLPFKTPLETRTFHEDDATGPYDPLQDGDLLMYVAGFVDNPKTEVPLQVPLAYTCVWRNLDFFTPKDLGLMMLARDIKDGELAVEEEPSTLRSATASTQQASESAVSTGFTLEEQEPSACSTHAPMTDFQWACK